MQKSRSTAPIIAAVLLLVPVLYVGSYFALVVPQGIYPVGDPFAPTMYYRFGNGIAQRLYWPLERIDRRLRPKAWEIDPFG